MLEAAVHRVVLHLVGEVVGVGDDVDDADDVDLLAEQALIAEGLEDQATDSAETVDRDFDCHSRSLLEVFERNSLDHRALAAQETAGPSRWTVRTTFHLNHLMFL